MTTRSLLAASLALAAPLAAADPAAPATAGDTPAAAPLALQTYHGDAGSFHVSATLITGRTEAVLLDAGFTRADALRIAAMVLESHRKLTTIYISQADPDFYFGLDLLRQTFPTAKIIATAPTVERIQATWQGKLQFWGPKLGDNAPQTVPLPAAMTGRTITLEDQVIEIRGLDDALPHRSYAWIPSLHAIAGGVNLFAGLHVWTADTKSAEDRAAWLATLDAMAALHPRIVIPGHAVPDAAQDATQIAYTREYLQRFSTELAKAPTAADLIASMQAAYPQAGLPIALDIGAKVAKGEMAW